MHENVCLGVVFNLQPTISVPFPAPPAPRPFLWDVSARWFWGVALSGGVLGKVMHIPYVDKLEIHHFGGDFALTNFLFFERQLSPNSVDMI